ncbi:MAG: F0F1 ATP synthase subunit delta [Citromicrobium sp.]|nr:F0F1 ATP synthase subunit delta [Citromicrobium sp.]
MEISAGIQASLAGRYAVALFELASEDGVVSPVESDLDTLAAALDQSPDLAGLTTNPQLGRKAKMAAIEEVAKLLEVSPLTRRFLGVLAENRRLAELPRMIQTFRQIAAAQRGEVSAEVISAHPLGEDQIASLKQKLTAREGRTVKLTHSVDPDMLGGLIVTIGSKRIDGSIRTRLNALTQAMKG